MRASLADRFFAKVDRSVGPDACWLWSASRTVKGYGKFTKEKSHGWTHAHRVSWELTNGPIPPGMYVSHRCGERLCVNTRHLALVTAEQNWRRNGPLVVQS
jgi:hypothetical protein